MAKRYQKDIKVVLPKSDPFRDIAVYGAGEEMIKALGGELPDKGKQLDIVPSSNNPYFKKGIKKFGDGGTNKTKLSKKDESLFNEFYKTLPNNLRVDDPTYDIRGYWDSEGRPNKFNYDQPKDSDGYYHAYSINSNTGEYLKSPLHPTFRQAVEEDRKIGYRPITNMYGRNIAIENKSIADPEEESILINTEGPKNYIKAYGGYINNTDNMKKSNKKGQSPRSILSPEQKMAMEFGWGGGLSGGLSGAATGASIGSIIPGVGTAVGAGVGALIGGISGHLNEKKQDDMQNTSMQMPYQQPLPQQMQFAKGGMLNKRGIPNRGTSEQMPYQSQMQSYPNLEFGNGEQMLAMGGELEDTEMYAKGGIHIKPSKRGTFTAAATKHGKSVQAFASQVLANKENYSPAMVKKANFARNAAKWKHADGGFLNEPAEGVIERRNKNRSREPQEYATFEENFKHMYAQGGRMGAMGPMDVGNIYYADGGMLNKYNGYRHEDGGIPIGPNAEVEGGETSMKMGMGGEQDSTYIYSDRLKVPGKNYTFAEASKKIDNKYNRRTNDKLSDESKRLELNKLMESQEQERAGLVNSAYQTIAAYGGPIRKYAVGGVDPVGKNSYYSGTDPVMNELMRFSAPTNPNRYMMALERMHGISDFDDYGKDAWKKADQEDLAFQNEIASQLDQETPSSPYINLNPSIKERIAAKKESRLNKKMKFNPNAYLDNNTPNKSRDFSPAEIDQMMQEAPAKTTPAQYNIPVRGITSQGSSVIPDLGGGRSTAPNVPTTPVDKQGFNWTPLIGYAAQALGLGAEAMRLRGKNKPNKAFTMERQVLNAKPQLDEVDVSAAIANRNIQTLGASTSSGGAMAGYLAAQAGRTRSKADIMADLQNRQAQIDMTTGQYNAMAGERAYDKDAADKAAQQSAYSQLFSNVGKLGATIGKDYGMNKSQEIARAALGTADFEYKWVNGKLVQVPKGKV